MDDSRIQLDENEWSQIKEKYKKREEYKEPCVICKESLGVQQQVLLSCTHTFHRKCLEVFEKFSGKKCCPMCRKERYKARVVHDASKHHKNLCAAKYILILKTPIDIFRIVFLKNSSSMARVSGKKMV